MARRAQGAGWVAVGALLLGGCTTVPDHDAPAPSAAALAPTSFGPVSADGTGSNDWVEALATRGSEVVAVGRVLSWRSMPTFRRSTDGGWSWTEGALDPTSLAATPLASDEYPTALAQRAGTGWVALGAEDRGVAWTSQDGLTWTRHALPIDVVDPTTDDVADLAVTPSGFVAVGTRSTGATDRPVAWTSPDGVAWTRHGLSGDGSALAVAVRGATVVVAGATEQPGDARSWRSTDAGRTWVRVAVPRPPGDGDFSRGLTDVTATGEGFVALGRAWRDDDWYATVFRSRDGSRWSYDRSADSLGGHPMAGAALPGGSANVAALRRVAKLDRVELWRRSGTSWERASTPLDAAPVRAAWEADALVRTPAGWLVAVTEENNGRLQGHLWLSTDGQSYADLGAVRSRWDADATFPDQVALAGDTVVVGGRAQGLPVVWTTSPPTPYAAAWLEPDARFDEDGLTAVAGRLLAWGSDLGGNSRYACVWTSSDGRSWVRTKAGTFGRYDTYGYSQIQQVRRLGERWVAVGEHSENGPAQRSALISTSTDGRSWTAGRSADRYRKTEPDYDYVVTDLAGGGDHVRTVDDVVDVGSGLLAVGAAAETGEVQPAVWTTVTNRGREAWELRRLPLTGFASAEMFWVESRGDLVVVLGTATRKGSGVDLPYVWRSVDAGRTWSGGLLPVDGLDPAHLDLGGLVLTDHAFLVTGNVRDDVSRPVTWRSADGTDWEPLRLDGVPAGTGLDVDLHGVVASGSDLVGVLRLRTTAGASSSVFRQSVP